MTELSRRDLVDILRSRLGIRYLSSIDDGRDEITNVIKSELGISSAEAENMVSQLIETGRIRYVTAAEHDSTYDPEAVSHEHNDYETNKPDYGYRTEVSDPRELVRDATVASSFATTGAAPVAAGGTYAPAAAPLIANAVAGTPSTGYWDFQSESTGVVPSTSRKGQVEPSGT